MKLRTLSIALLAMGPAVSFGQDDQIEFKPPVTIEYSKSTNENTPPQATTQSYSVESLPPAPEVSASNLEIFLNNFKAGDVAKANATGTSPLPPTDKTKETAGVKSKPAEPGLSEDLKKRLDAEFKKKEDDGWEDTENGWAKPKVFGRLLMESAYWGDDSEIPGGNRNYFEFRQMRIGMMGSGYGVFDYKLDLEFEPEFSDTNGAATVSNFGSVAMKDVFLGINDLPIFNRVQMGHFKVPFSIEQIHNRGTLSFLERDPMTDGAGFTPAREVGIASYNISEDRNSTFSYGMFIEGVSEESKQRFDDNHGLVLASRWTWTPYFDEPSNGRYVTHVGMGFVHTTTQSGTVRFRGRPSIHEGRNYIDSGTISSSEYTVYGAEFASNMGPTQFQSELFYTDIQEFNGGTFNPWSGYAQVAYRLTGEHKIYDRKLGAFNWLDPHENFWMVPGSSGTGAWEVAMRYSYMDFNDTLIPGELHNLTFGVNWYWTRNIIARMNYIHPITNEGIFGDTESDVVSMRLAVYF